jgi:hypothetical protein
MSYLRRAWLFLLILLVGYCASAYADNLSWELDGKLHAGAWSSDRSLNSRSGVFPATMALQGKLHLTDSLRLFADGRVGDTAYFSEDRYATVLPKSCSMIRLNWN